MTLETRNSKSDGTVVRKFIDLSTDTVSWLMERGVDLIYVSSVQKGRSFETFIGYKELGHKYLDSSH